MSKGKVVGLGGVVDVPGIFGGTVVSPSRVFEPTDGPLFVVLAFPPVGNISLKSGRVAIVFIAVKFCPFLLGEGAILVITVGLGFTVPAVLVACAPEGFMLLVGPVLISVLATSVVACAVVKVPATSLVDGSVVEVPGILDITVSEGPVVDVPVEFDILVPIVD